MAIFDEKIEIRERCKGVHFSPVDSKTVQRSALCRSRRELSNEYLLAKIGVDTAENEPCKVCPLSAYRSPRFETPLEEYVPDPVVVEALDAFLILHADHEQNASTSTVPTA